jgi:hypothetical protein
VSENKPLYESPGERGKRGFEDLECYKLALEAMARIDAFSKSLPIDEKYDLYAQIRRASKGVTANIAEAYGRYHYLDSLHYYSIARNGFMAYVRRQRAGSQDFGNKRISEGQTDYDVSSLDEESD